MDMEAYSRAEIFVRTVGEMREILIFTRGKFFTLCAEISSYVEEI